MLNTYKSKKLVPLLWCFGAVILIGCDSEAEARKQKADRLNEELRQLILAKEEAESERRSIKWDYAESLHEEAEQIVMVEEIRSHVRLAETAGEIALLMEDLKSQKVKLEALTKLNDEFEKKLNDILVRFSDEKERAICDAIYAYRLRLMAAAKNHVIYRSTPDWKKKMHEYHRLNAMSDFDAQWFLDEFGSNGLD